MKDYINYALILFAVIVIAIGQIMFKTAARMISVPPGAGWPVSMRIRWRGGPRAWRRAPQAPDSRSIFPFAEE